MQDSNQFHAVCLDTFPPLFYMNSTSQAVIELVHRYNQICQQVKVCAINYCFAQARFNSPFCIHR